MTEAIERKEEKSPAAISLPLIHPGFHSPLWSQIPDLRMEKETGGVLSGGHPAGTGHLQAVSAPEDPTATSIRGSPEGRSTGVAADPAKVRWFSVGVHSSLEVLAAYLNVSQQSSHKDKATAVARSRLQCHASPCPQSLLASAPGLRAGCALPRPACAFCAHVWKFLAWPQSLDGVFYLALM